MFFFCSSLNRKLAYGRKNPLIKVPAEFHDGYRLALLRCQDPDIKKVYVRNVSEILNTFMGKHSPVKQSSLLCKIISFSGPANTDSCTTIVMMLMCFILKNLNTRSDDLMWIIRIINEIIQRHFLALKCKKKTLHARIFYICFLISLIEGQYFDIKCLNERIIKLFLCHNGLRYLITTIRLSIKTNILLGQYLSKQLLSYVLALIEVTHINDSSEAFEALMRLKPTYDQTFSRFLECWNYDYAKYNFVPKINITLLKHGEWNILITFLYIGVTYVKKFDPIISFLNLVSLLEFAIIKEFEVSESLKRKMFEIYCVSTSCVFFFPKSHIDYIKFLDYVFVGANRD